MTTAFMWLIPHTNSAKTQSYVIVEQDITKLRQQDNLFVEVNTTINILQ